MEDVKNYLDKIKVHENVPNVENNAWVKNILHLGGGTAGAEGNEIRTRLRNMENIISKPMFGASTSTFFKENTAEVQIANLPKIKESINKGLGIINFFGHAAVGTFDFTLDDPANYENEGRLPFMFSLGCYSGNICTNGRGVSEKFVLNKGKGSTGFIAAAGTAFIHTQGSFGDAFYSKITNDFYNKPVGKIIKSILDDNHSVYERVGYERAGYDFLTLYQQLILHSDPAIKIHGFEKPDFAINNEKLKTIPEEVRAELDSFQLSYSIQNLKKGTSDSINILIRHISPEGKIVSENKQRVLTPSFEGDYKVKLNLSGFQVVGLNKIEVKIDSDNEVQEFNENNNDININNNKFYSFYILSSAATVVQPCEFGIVQDLNKLELIATTGNAFGKEEEFIFQIDTSLSFSSALKEEGLVRSSMSSIVWKPSKKLLNNKAYYWRVAKKPKSNEAPVWSVSSFSYLENGGTGWRQQHYEQYQENEFEYMKSIPTNDFVFENVSQLINVTSAAYTGELTVPFTLVNGGKYSSLTPFRGNANSLNVIVWTPNGFWQNKTRVDFGSLSHSTNIFPFDIGAQSGRKGVRQLLDAAPDSSVVFMFLYLRNFQSTLNKDEWESDLNTLGFTIFNTMEDYGAKKFRNLSQDIKPYIYVFRKGFGVLDEKIGVNIADVINSSTTAPFKGFFGKMRSVIGPVKSWKKFSWDFDFDPVVPTDTFVRNGVNIYTIDKQNQKALISKGNKSFDLSKIDSKNFPKIELEYEVTQFYNYTPATIYNWTVNYETFPDFSVEMTQNIPDTIDQGDDIILKGLVNLKESIKEDKVNVKFSLIDVRNQRIEKVVSLSNIEENKAIPINHVFNTKDINGQYQVIVNVNFDNGVDEKININNNAVKNIFIKPDMINPVLDVTFDGIKILEGDVVRPTPTIQINLTDENKKLLIDKPESISYTLMNLKDNKPVILNSNEVNYKLSNNVNDNKLEFTLLPKLPDGEYSLSVNGKDYSGNVSGEINYNIRFKVVSKKSISNFMNYPNPFSNSTRFVFDITGDVPQNFKVMIMTITGKVVREITASEFGNIKMGKNMSDYVWNGTDEFGNKLANGVYLYKIVVPKEQGFEISNEYDVNGFGKMMIVR